MKGFKTVHDLPFEIGQWEFDKVIGGGFLRFRVGSCSGIWRSTPTSYEILGITNDQPGNGHFEDVLQWFYNSCVRDRKDFRILEVWNKDLKQHLIKKRGFSFYGVDDVQLSYWLNKKL